MSLKGPTPLLFLEYLKNETDGGVVEGFEPIGQGLGIYFGTKVQDIDILLYYVFSL